MRFHAVQPLTVVFFLFLWSAAVILAWLRTELTGAGVMRRAILGAVLLATIAHGVAAPLALAIFSWGASRGPRDQAGARIVFTLLGFALGISWVIVPECVELSVVGGAAGAVAIIGCHLIPEERTPARAWLAPLILVSLSSVANWLWLSRKDLTGVLDTWIQPAYEAAAFAPFLSSVALILIDRREPGWESRRNTAILGFVISAALLASCLTRHF